MEALPAEGDTEADAEFAKLLTGTWERTEGHDLKYRIYLTGYSMGGFGTFHLLAQEPQLFAAGIPIAGGGNPSSAGSFKKVPVWVFHGTKDPIVPVDLSRSMVEALEKERADPKYTEFPDGNHGIANQVYADQAVHEWLFEQTQ